MKAARTFDYVLDGKRDTMTLNPCEIRTIDRKVINEEAQFWDVMLLSHLA